MIIFTTITSCYSVFISVLAVFCYKKLQEKQLELVELKNVGDNLEKANGNIELLQTQNRINESSINSQNKKILELSNQNSSQNSLLTKSEELNKEIKIKLENRVANYEATIKDLNNKNLILSNTEAKIEVEKNSLEQKIAEQKTFMQEVQKNLKTEFENITNRQLKDNSSEFLKNSSSKLTDILEPYKKDIEALKTKIDGTYDKESKERFSLGTQVEKLLTQTNKISAEANNLASALKGQNKKQGNWGEMILESILQNSGLMKDYQYRKEENIKDDEGKNLRPDFIVKLPHNRVVIIDSKTSLVGYEKYCSAEDLKMQELYLKEHLASIKNHIDSLSDKKYDDLEASLDFTLMFIPIEPAYIVAMQFDSELWNYAYKKRIILISATNLIACLKLINELWRREDQDKNQAEILKQVGALYDKFVVFSESIEKIGKQISGANNAYDDAIKQLRDGKGNLIDRVEKIKKLGIKTNKTLISKILPDEFQEEIDKKSQDLVTN
jgi:DNA recombination protein RmuC